MSSLCRLKVSHFSLNEFLDQSVIDELFVVVGAPAPEEVNERLALKFGGEVLPEAPIELLREQEAILVRIEILDRPPHQLLLVHVSSHQGHQI